MSELKKSDATTSDLHLEAADEIERLQRHSKQMIDHLNGEIEQLRAALETVIPLLIYYSKDLEDQQAILKARAALEQKADTE